ncbi:MAG: Na/Pi cotransporter family protein [Acidobacteriota bacterium]
MTIIFQAFGGLGLFLMGMKLMSEGMQKTAGDKLRNTLNLITSNRIFAITVGLFITTIIQSSSATTVMVVGFVNASLMGLQQAIGVILGANVGTTITGWLVTLKIVKYSMPLIGIGVFIRFFSKNEMWKHAGEIIFGFGLLFLGMQTMKIGFAPLRESEEFIELFMKVDGLNYFTILSGIAIGAVTTFIVQSSSATIGITIALASQGLIGFEGAVSLILGENIGTTVTALLASIGANYNAKRAAIAHTLFNVFGVVIMIIIFFPFVAFVEKIIPGVSNFIVSDSAEALKYSAAIGAKPFIGSHIAAAHTIFNVSNVVFFTMLIPLLAKVCEKIIPTPKNLNSLEIHDFKHIESYAVDTPSIGIAETEKKIDIMFELLCNSSSHVKKIMDDGENSTDICDSVLSIEKHLDSYKKHITEFLVTLSSHSLSEKDSHYIGDLLTLTHNLEKFGDNLEHIALIFDKINRKKIDFPQNMKIPILEIFDANIEFFEEAYSSFHKSGPSENILNRTQVINRRIKKSIKDSKKGLVKKLDREMLKDGPILQIMDILNYIDGLRSESYNISEVTSGTKLT